MKKLLVIFFLAFLLVETTCGQVPFFQHYFLLRKNEPVKVNTIFQDKAGFIWYGTNKGLFRFDGIYQKRYTTADSLPDNNVTAIAQDLSGRIWAGHKNGRLSYIEKNTIKKFDAPEGSATKEISDILFDQKGNMWFSTLGDGLYYFTQDRLFRLDEKEKMPDLFIYDITEDDKGNIWAGTDGGVAICALNGKDVTLKVLNYKNGLPDNIIRKLAAGENGTMWMGTEDAGVIQYDPASGAFKHLLESKWHFGTITDFLLNGNQVWISCMQKGLLVYDQKTKQLKVYDAKAEADLTSIHALLKDYEGNIWIGAKSGVMRTPGDFLEYIETLEPAKDVNIIALAVDKQSNIWFSTGEGLFRRSVDTSGAVVSERQEINESFQKHAIISLFVDQDGYIWAGLYGEGAIRINPVTGKMRYFDKELNDGNVLNISGKDNLVWLSTLGGVTQIKIAGEQVSIQNYNGNAGLISDYIYQVFTDSQNRSWFATDGKGVDMKDESGFHHYQEGLKSKVVYGFAEDGDHHIWANVQGDGLYKFDGKKFIAAGALAPFRNNNINCLSSDQSGNLVLMHDLGLDIYDVRKNKIYFLGDETGIHDKRPNLNAVAKDGAGRIFFGTDHGIIIYSGGFNHGRIAPLPFIDGLKVFNKNIDSLRHLDFKYNENDITINYLGFWYQNPGNLNFQYKLENYDRDWITSRNHATTYSNLPPGEYVFRLRVSDTEEFKDSKETSLRFIVKPPFWRTTWFYILSTAASILFIFTFIKYRERKLQHDKKILEAKNAELKKTNMELDKFVYSVSHDLRTPLSGMLGIIEISEDETDDAMQLKHLGMLKGGIQKLDGFILDILDYSRNSRLDIRNEKINFKQMLEEITSNLNHIRSSNHKPEIKIHVAEEVYFHSDKTRVGVVLNNLIANAIRYQNPKSENPLVSIEVITSPEAAHIMVKDNGIGIRKENHQKIFEMFYRISENSVGSGLGLYIVKETVDKLKGHIIVESELGKGTAFNIRIPNN